MRRKPIILCCIYGRIADYIKHQVAIPVNRVIPAKQHIPYKKNGAWKNFSTGQVTGGDIRLMKQSGKWNYL